MTTVETSSENAPNSAAPRAVDWENPRVASILAAAAKCFARNGFSATTLAEIGKELGLRKSIVHYYFASKGALIHEVQSYSYQRYMERVRAAVNASGDNPKQRAMGALRSLWDEIQSNRVGTALNLEVWSASRRDAELKRRSSALQRDARKLIGDGIGDVLGGDVAKLTQFEALSTLILAVLNGLAISDFLEGEDAKNKEAYDVFLFLLTLGIQALQDGKVPAQVPGA